MKTVGSQEIFYNDVTLRDGEQAPGNTMTFDEKLTFARQLHKFGLAGIEAGFPNSAQADFDAVQAIAQEVGNTPLVNPSQESRYVRISGLARLHRGDIEKTIEAVKDAAHPGVHTFISTSDIQRIKFDDLIERRGGRRGNVRDFVDKVVVPDIEELFPVIRSSLPDGVLQFSPEDWVRTDDKSVGNEVILAAAANGANVINLPDTVGIGIPEDIGHRVRKIRNLLDKNGFKHVMISWHGHNDTAMAAANTITAVHSGARQVETTVLGVGERTGNIGCEGVIASLDASPERHAQLAYEMRMNPMQRTAYRWLVERGVITPKGIRFTDTLVRENMMETAQMLADILDIEIPREYPIVGANAFKHESGIHADGDRKGKQNGVANVYEVLEPERYGTKSTTVIGQQAGWSNLQNFMEQHDLPYRQEDRAKFVSRMKSATAGRRKGLSDEESLQNIYDPVVIELTGGPLLNDIQITSQGSGPTTVSIATNDDRGEIEGTSDRVDGGMIDAAIHGLKSVIPGIEVSNFTVKDAKTGEGSSSEAVVRLTLSNGSKASVVTRHHNTQQAIKLAIIEATNAIHAMEKYKEMC